MKPKARIRSWGIAGVPPEVMGLGPVPAIQSCLARAGMKLDEMDLVEVNEAFAPVPLACCETTKLTPRGTGYIPSRIRRITLTSC